jgi:hypothetical protein
MPLTTALVVTGIVTVFALFGIVLAWGDRQTRNLNRAVQDNEPQASAEQKKAA